MTTPAIQVSKVSKSFNQTRAVNAAAVDAPAVEDVSFTVAPGTVFGLIGPDGAGKTTLIRMLVTLLGMDSGTVTLNGHDLVRERSWIRRHVGYMPQRFSLYPDLSVGQNLRFFGDLFGIDPATQQSRIQALYSFSKLEKFHERPAGKLSGGMKQKLALSCVLMHQPPLLILDEPTVGVDPVSREEFWDILLTLSKSGTTILVSTSYMNEAAKCHAIGLMYNGRLLAKGQPDTLAAAYPNTLYTVRTPFIHQLYTALKATVLSAAIQLFGDTIHITDYRDLGAEKIAYIIRETRITHSDFGRISAGLEDLFLQLIHPELIQV